MTTLDFILIKDLNPNRILFLDTSDYSSTPISPTLHVKFPDFNKEYSTPIQFGQVNIINTARLKFSESITEFPDGPYHLTFEVNNKQCRESKCVFITTKAYSQLSEMLTEIDYTNKDLLEIINKINLYLQGAESVVNSNETQAIELYKQATNLLKCHVRMSVKQQCSSCK